MINTHEIKPDRVQRGSTRTVLTRSQLRWLPLLRIGVLFLLVLWFVLLTLFFLSQVPSPATAAKTVSHTSSKNPIGYGGYEDRQSFSATKQSADILADPTSTPDASQSGGFSLSNPFSINPSQWLWDGITGFFDQLWRQVVDFFQHQIIDLASSYGFLYITPAALSYKNPMVLAGAEWSLMAMDGLVALFLVMAGYQVIIS